MGNTQSTNIQKVVTATDLNISQDEYQNINQTCNQSGSANNLVEIVGSSDVKLNASQKNELTNMCILNTLLTSNRSNDAKLGVFNDIAAKATATGGFPAADASNHQDIRNQMSANISMDSYVNVLQKCTSKSNTDNIIRIVGSKGVDANVSQVNAAFNKCLLESAKDNGITSTASAESTTKAKATATAEGGQLLNIASAGSSCVMCVAILAVLAFMLMQ